MVQEEAVQLSLLNQSLQQQGKASATNPGVATGLIEAAQHTYIHTYSIHMHTTVFTYTHTIVVTRECSRAQQGIEHLREAHPL